tara:strand:+ start:348 stop:611 length:264 start_codon:yes stop_codon:yes gene_type:complete
MNDNKLIAEFMGYRVFGNKCRKPMPYSLKGWLVDDIAPMQFHTEWNWLMPVIIKMADIREDTHYKLYKTIDEAYEEVVEFLKNNKIA